MPSKYPKYLEKLGVMIRLPIVDWQTEDVFEFCFPITFNVFFDISGFSFVAAHFIIPGTSTDVMLPVFDDFSTSSPSV